MWYEKGDSSTHVNNIRRHLHTFAYKKCILRKTWSSIIGNMCLKSVYIALQQISKWYAYLTTALTIDLYLWWTSHAWYRMHRCAIILFRNRVVLVPTDWENPTNTEGLLRKHQLSPPFPVWGWQYWFYACVALRLSRVEGGALSPIRVK